MNDKEKLEWQHIQLYSSAQADAFRTVLEIAPGPLNEEARKWLQSKYESATHEREEADRKLSVL